ncbi:serine/threonine-protein kinase pim-1-like [Archocentrus centrarchus]|uniref:serine/threonine-protein kinase pim-1-like n=1 Tax=Archocentrus centrarchus TaxID=63155 RepID=UPI0011EA0FD3|nr:serine/threonine-protein kinase pim-1-like [Archocentrus centrarchus]
MLGRGGFGSVFAGRRKSDNLPVAIKQIRKEYVERQRVDINGEPIMFPVEALSILKVGGIPSAVGSSAVVSILEWYDLEKEVFLVMERPDPCVTLLNYMLDNGGCLEEEVAKNIMKQLVDAALMMHREGVFHRDIKLANLLIETGSNDPRVRVIVFGCSCLVQEEPYFNLFGSRRYAPPEFFKCGLYRAAPTTVWQLGAMLYEMLHAKRCFDRYRLRNGRLYFNNRQSRDCQNFMRQCLTLDLEQRPTLEQLQQHPWLQN